MDPKSIFSNNQGGLLFQRPQRYAIRLFDNLNLAVRLKSEPLPDSFLNNNPASAIDI
jgi:hypothetical protein